MAKSLAQSTNYKRFISERDKALNELLKKYQILLSSIVSTLKKNVTFHIMGRLAVDRSFSKTDHKLDMLFQSAANQAYLAYIRAKRTMYGLAYVGEVEALKRAYGKKKKTELTKGKIETILSGNSFAGGKVHERINMYFDNLRRKLDSQVQVGTVYGEKPEEIKERINRAFPKRRPLPRASMFRKVKEASYVPKEDVVTEYKDRDDNSFMVSSGLIDEETWDNLLDDYQSEYIDPVAVYGRSGETTYPIEGKPDEIYDWEMEQDLNTDMVQAVRDGQLDAAKDNGITDFQWIAIIDDKTDDCCVWRDGLTSKEIEAQLEGEHSGDDCDAITPPAHFNCRCTLAPVTEDLPENAPYDFEDFDTWLMS